MVDVETPPTAGPKAAPRELIEFFTTAPGGPHRPRCVGRLRAPAGFGDWIVHTEETPEAAGAPSLRISRDGRALFETEGEDGSGLSEGVETQRAQLELITRQVQAAQQELLLTQQRVTALQGQAALEQTTVERLLREVDDVRAQLRSEREFLAAERAALLPERQKLLDQAIADRERLLTQTVADREAILHQNVNDREKLLGDGEAARQRARQEAQQRVAELEAVTHANINALNLVDQTVRQIGVRVHEHTMTMLDGDKAMTDVLSARQAEQIADLQEMRLVIRDAVPEKPGPDPKSEMWLQIGTSVAKVLGRIDPNKVGSKLLRVLGEDDD